LLLARCEEVRLCVCVWALSTPIDKKFSNHPLTTQANPKIRTGGGFRKLCRMIDLVVDALQGTRTTPRTVGRMVRRSAGLNRHSNATDL